MEHLMGADCYHGLYTQPMKFEKNTSQIAHLQWLKHLNWKLEMNTLLPDTKEEEEVDKIRQTKMQQITSAIRLHEWSFAWKKSKQVTEIIQRCHKDTMEYRT
ncbi:hypothetical protein RFI_39434 [Reticulomyxa filosa]|uniref:Uncharacterized protein n=1 Tax=Reticulomyxa filosa TaxID=46433 RepID=X6L980_RETFI|nr:hypothetical protein RFI_39434 [Reticulomyxa filosa]|eukprot:ETN98088.1 hypothetical protein RFI_39434 [Reticulomyxa filosa]